MERPVIKKNKNNNNKKQNQNTCDSTLLKSLYAIRLLNDVHI